MKWFNHPQTLEELKKQYKQLAVKHHPDKGGNTADMQEINAEYNRLFEKLKNIRRTAEGKTYTTKTETRETANDFKDYLQKHKKMLFTTLLAEGKLYQHCAEIENQANDMFDTLVEQMKAAEGATEQLKEENQMEWVKQIENIQQRAREVVLNETVCI